MAMELNRLSASSIAAFKKCPTSYRLAYVQGLRLERDGDAARVGTNWHALHECYANAMTWPLCEQWPTEEDRPAMAFQAIFDLLNRTYANVPAWAEAADWALERQIFFTSFMAYQWYWQNDPLQFLVSELPFELPLHEPRTGMPCSTKSVVRLGKIDHVVKWHGAVCNLERKSTSKSIEPDSVYWEGWRKNTQVSMYALAFRDLLASGTLPSSVTSGERFGNTLVDIWHKPTIRPAMLTQANTAAFLESGTYCGEAFTVVSLDPITVNGVKAEVEHGKKGFAIRETLEMFGARLMAEIQEHPDKYFARREIARTDKELAEFRRELFAVYQAQSLFIKSGCWFSNESQCRATFACPFIPICFGPGAESVCDGVSAPAGFVRKYVDLTVAGQPVPEE